MFGAIYFGQAYFGQAYPSSDDSAVQATHAPFYIRPGWLNLEDPEEEALVVLLVAAL